MYLSSPSKQLVVSNFIALPLTGKSVIIHPLGALPVFFSIIFCLIALFEILHIGWRHFHPNQNWQ